MRTHHLLIAAGQDGYDIMAVGDTGGKNKLARYTERVFPHGASSVPEAKLMAENIARAIKMTDEAEDPVPIFLDSELVEVN